MQDRGTWAFEDIRRDKALGFIGCKVLTKLNYDMIFHTLEGGGLNRQQISIS